MLDVLHRAVGSKNELVRPYSHFETLVQAPLVDLGGTIIDDHINS